MLSSLPRSSQKSLTEKPVRMQYREGTLVKNAIDTAACFALFIVVMLFIDYINA